MTAEQIMRRKSFIKEEMDRQYPKAQSDELWERATKKLDEILNRYANLPKGVHTHTDTYIFPSAALYLTARDIIGTDRVYKVIEDAAIRNSSDAGKKLAKLMKIPGMTGLFVKIWDPMTKRMFGTGNGFTNRFYPKKKGEYRMDILSCPYCRYFTELGCPELTKIFCDNDERVYGDLPGLSFRRAGTLGKGADCCDFYLKKI